MRTDTKSLGVWTLACALTVLLGTSLVVARPGGGGSDSPCHKNNPAYTNACSHWTDNTNPGVCDDVTSGPNDPCPGVMEWGPGAESITTITSTSCHVIQKYWDTQAGDCVTTEFDQAINCTQPSGLTCQ